MSEKMNSETLGYPPPSPYECSGCGDEFESFDRFDHLDRCKDCSKYDLPQGWSKLPTIHKQALFAQQYRKYHAGELKSHK